MKKNKLQENVKIKACWKSLANSFQNSIQLFSTKMATSSRSSFMNIPSVFSYETEILLIYNPVSNILV